jgi:hypothetical protein
VNELVTFNPKNHTYWWGKRQLPSVTTIIAKAIAPFKHFPDTPDHKKYLEYKGQLGTAVHKLAEYELKGTLDEGSIHESIKGYHTAIQAARKAINIRPICIEKAVYSTRLGFAGTMDLRAIIDIQGLEYYGTLDWKSSNSIWEHYRIQKAFYQIGWFETFTQHSMTGMKQYEVNGERLWLPDDYLKEKLVTIKLQADGDFQLKVWSDRYQFESLCMAIDTLRKYHEMNGGWS